MKLYDVEFNSNNVVTQKIFVTANEIFKLRTHIVAFQAYNYAPYENGVAAFPTDIVVKNWGTENDMTLERFMLPLSEGLHELKVKVPGMDGNPRYTIFTLFVQADAKDKHEVDDSLSADFYKTTIHTPSFDGSLEYTTTYKGSTYEDEIKVYAYSSGLGTTTNLLSASSVGYKELPFRPGTFVKTFEPHVTVDGNFYTNGTFYLSGNAFTIKTVTIDGTTLSVLAM